MQNLSESFLNWQVFLTFSLYFIFATRQWLTFGSLIPKILLVREKIAGQS